MADTVLATMRRGAMPSGLVQTYTQNLGVLMPQRDAEPTARDYVQDGLICHYDGLENQGYGVFVPSGKTWVDLTGITGNAVDIYYGRSTFSWDDAGGYTGYMGFKSPDITLDFSDGITVEFCSLMESSWGLYESNVVYTSNGSGYGYASNYGARYPQSGSVGGLMRAWGSGLHTRVVRSEGPSQPYVSGFVDGTKQTINAGTGGAVSATRHLRWRHATADFADVVYAIRLYSRALTDDEVLSNYKLDKARFNLP